MRLSPFLFSLFLTGAGTALAAGQYHSPYTGEQNRVIRSLSQADMEELLRGGGWGLARPAELNGMPGPAHVLEMAEDINLSSEQQAQTRRLFEEMQADARRLGKELIEREYLLNESFASVSVTADTLPELVRRSADIRAELRVVHLSAHLAMLDILTAEQIHRYNQLRGYLQDACSAVPEGHDAAMWRRHHNCDG